MISNIPTPDDFYQAGKGLFNFAWSAVLELVIEFEVAKDCGFDEPEDSTAYWAAATQTLTTSMTIVQQGVEFILKGKIAEISPYLLIQGTPTHWPSPYEGTHVDFSNFRTIDAQDLVRVLDTVAPTKLSGQFTERFHALRERRNVMMHSVSSSVSISAEEIIKTILYMHRALLPNENWPSVRHEFLESSPSSEVGDEFAINIVSNEIETVRNLLEPNEVLEYLRLHKKQRAYLCPVCLGNANTDVDFEIKLAELNPKGSETTRLYCTVCNEEHEVVRESCQEEGCEGNVLSADEGRCLTCGFNY